MESNGMYDEERFDINMADEGKAYSDGFDDGVIAALKCLIGHTLEDDGWTWTISKEDVQFVADKFGVKIDDEN